MADEVAFSSRPSPSPTPSNEADDNSDDARERKELLLREARNHKAQWVDEESRDRGEPTELSNEDLQTKKAKAREDPADLPVTRRLVSFLSRISGQSTEETSVLQEAAKPLHLENIESTKKSGFTYQEFLEKLKQPVANELVKSIRHFVQNFLNSELPQDAGSIIRRFLSNMEQTMISHPIGEGATEAEIEGFREGLEKFVMTKLNRKVFITEEDREKDEELHRKISLLSFLEPKHLDIEATDPSLNSYWKMAQDQLQQINHFRAPRDKMICILNCCKVILSLLSMSHADDTLPGADEFLPALIYVVIRANPPHLHSNLNYITTYRHPSQLSSEPGYFFTQLFSAVAFLDQVDASCLSISPEEFETGMKRCESELQLYGFDDAKSEKSTTSEQLDVTIGPLNPMESLSQTKDPEKNEETDSEKVPSVQNVQQAFPQMLSSCTTMNHTNQSQEKRLFPVLPVLSNTEQWNAWRASRYRFINKTADNLRLGDIPALLKEYKHIAAAFEKLLLQVNDGAMSLSSENTLENKSQNEF